MRIDDEDRLTKRRLHDPGPQDNPWLLPATFQLPPAGKAYGKCIIARQSPDDHNYAGTGELLVPAPAGAKPRRTVRRYMTIFRVRRYIHFLVGSQSGHPAAIGWVEPMPEITAEAFALRVSACGVKELAAFSPREAAFMLEAVAGMHVGSPVSAALAERVDGGTKREELAIRPVARALVGH